MRAIIYCRVSSEDQVKNLSLSTQEDACREYCKRNNLVVDTVFVEKGESAKTVDRTEFQKLLTYCREKKGRVNVLVVYALSRFARDKYDHFAIRALLHRFQITLRSVTEPIDESPTGKLMEGVLASFAQFDNDQRSERTKTGMQAAINIGRWTFQAPIGYLNTKDANGNPTLALDPERAPLIRLAFEKYATGLYTKQAVLDMVITEGLLTRRGRMPANQEFDRVLANPLYTGWIRVGTWKTFKQGNFPPLIDQETFDRVQAILKGRRPTLTPHERNHPDFPLRVFVKCATCGQPITGSWSRGRNKKYPYYHCPGRCRGINVRKEKLELEFTKLLERMQVRHENVALFRKIVVDQWEEKQDCTISLLAACQRQIKELADRKQNLLDAFVYQKAIDQDSYEQQRDKLEEEITLAKLRLKDAQLDEVDVEAILNFAETFLLNTARIWLEMSLEQRQRFQKVLFPEGIEVMPHCGIRTAVTCPVFKMLQPEMTPHTSLATPAGFEPALPP